MKRVLFVLLLFVAAPARADWLEADANRSSSGVQGDSTASGGGTDDTTAIQAFLSAASSGDTVVLGASKSGRYYRITSQLSAGAGVSFLCYGTIVKDYTTNDAAVSLGNVATASDGIRVRCSVIRLSQSDWASEADIGVRIINPQNADIDIPLAKGCTIGCQILGQLPAYNNHVRLGLLQENKVGVDLRSNAVGGQIYNNQLLGGRFKVTTGVADGTTRYGIRISDAASSNETPVGNLFQGGHFDLSQTDANPGNAVGVQVESDNASFNRLTDFYAVDTTPGGASGSAPIFNALRTADGRITASSAPTSGSWLAGDYVTSTNATGTEATPIGWQCVTAGSPGTWKAVYRGRAIINGSKTYDFGSLAAGASESTTVTCTGAVAGDICVPSLTTALADGFVLTANVSASDTVKVTLANVGGATTDTASGTLRVQVMQP